MIQTCLRVGDGDACMVDSMHDNHRHNFGRCSCRCVVQMSQTVVQFAVHTTTPVMHTCASALLWSRRVSAVMFSAGMEGACSFSISALVLAGLATTRTYSSSRSSRCILLSCGRALCIQCA
jgi:hypothetical protein